MISYLIVGLFAAIVGSFLNVCIHRMPLGESVVWPRSHCPSCKKRISWYDNIPFLSYIALQGKCRHCAKHISLRYPLVEALTAVMCMVFFHYFGLKYDFFVFSLFGCALIIATFVDFAHRIIPDEVSLGGIVVGTILSAIRGVHLHPFAFDWHPFVGSLLGIVIGGGIIYGTGILFDFIYFKLLKRPAIQGETESMGGGDVKLLAMIGAFLGWQNALLTFFIAPFFGAVFGVINLWVKKDRTLPYGPFLSLAAVLSFFWGPQIIRLLLRY